MGESRALIFSLATPSGSLEKFTEEQKLLEIFLFLILKLQLHWVFAASSRLSQVAESRDTLVAACRPLCGDFSLLRSTGSRSRGGASAVAGPRL